jgi:cellulose synthase/poly-beta-1,6-N-acetylglucosamine synthase-like glycosyltransferase
MEKAQKQGKLDWIGSYSAAYRKADFARAGGFDESFPKASGEDAELSYRLAESGKKLVFAPRAIVYHTHPATLGKYLHVKFFRAYWRMRMYLKHPKKMVEDGYTPQSLKAGIVVGYLSLIFVMLLVYFTVITLEHSTLLGIFIGMMLLISGFILGLFLGGMIALLLSPQLLPKLQRTGFITAALAPFIVCLRSFAFGLGMLFGLLDPRVRA